MPGFKESSILFSLQGLLDREKERTDDEQNERLRAIEQANRVRLERERRHRDEEEQRVREAHERALREAAQRREHELRAEALKRAEVERVRLEAGSRARIETMAMQQEHERRMAAIELESRVRRFRALSLGGVAFGLATLACATALYLGKLRPEQARMEGAYAHLVTAEHARADDAQRLADKQKSKNDALGDELDGVKAKLADARRELAAQQQAHARRPDGPRVAPPPRVTHATNDVACGDPNDPMNPCLK